MCLDGCYFRNVVCLKQVVDKIKEINSSLCSCMFYLSCQSGLSREDTLILIGRMSTDSQEDYNSTLSDQTLALFMTFLYAIDVKILEREDSEGENLFKCSWKQVLVGRVVILFTCDY